MAETSLYVHRATRSPAEAANWDRRQVILNNVRSVAGRAYPRVRGISREKSWLAFEILLPFLSTSAFVFVYRALKAPPEYIGFVVLGGAMTAFWLNVVWMMAAQLYWDKDQGNLELFFAAPSLLPPRAPTRRSTRTSPSSVRSTARSRSWSAKPKSRCRAARPS